jgi:hypothetical protein
MRPRIPTSEEKIELIEFLLRHDFQNDENERQNIEGFVESASIAVFDRYITSSPGYSDLRIRATVSSFETEAFII